MILNQMQNATFSIYERYFNKDETIREYSQLTDFYIEFLTYDNEELILNSEIERILTLCFVEDKADYSKKLYDLFY